MLGNLVINKFKNDNLLSKNKSLKNMFSLCNTKKYSSKFVFIKKNYHFSSKSFHLLNVS